MIDLHFVIPQEGKADAVFDTTQDRIPELDDAVYYGGKWYLVKETYWRLHKHEFRNPRNEVIISGQSCDVVVELKPAPNGRCIKEVSSGR